MLICNNPIRTEGGGWNPDDPYLKFLDFSQLLVADTPMKFACGTEKERGPERVKFE